MSKVRFELDRAGVRALMRSPEMQAVLKARADTVKDRCGDGYEAYVAATLAAGLPETSRSLRKAAGRTVDFETELLAYAADRLTQVLWWLHSDTSKPPSVLADLRGEADTSNVQCYASAEEFDAALAALKGG